MSYVINILLLHLLIFAFWMIFRQIPVKSYHFMAGHHAHPWNFIPKIWNFLKFCLYLQQYCDKRWERQRIISIWYLLMQMSCISHGDRGVICSILFYRLSCNNSEKGDAEVLSTSVSLAITKKVSGQLCNYTSFWHLCSD